jgi:membrane associated rhomboid family serine protease
MTDVPPAGTPVCYRHPGRETYIRCTRCDRPICPDCMREAAVGHQCPECVAEGRRTQRQTRTAFGGSTLGRQGYVTITLIVINVLMLLLSLASAKNPGNAAAGGGLGGLLGGQTPLLRSLAVVGGPLCQDTVNGPVYGCGVAHGEYYRLFTAMFMHYGVLHLLLNMYALWVLGRTLEAFLGPVRFLALYLVAGLGGNVAAYVFQPNALSAGASTAIFGLFAALFLVLRKLGLNAASVLPVILLNLVFTISVPGISIAGHLGGFLVGGLVAAGLAYAPKERRSAIQTATIVVAVLALGGLSLWQTALLTA